MASSNEGWDLFEEISDINPFEVLGITPDTSFRDAHKKYLKLMRIHHSDKVGGDDSFTKLLTQAWSLLNDTGGDDDKWSQLAKQFYPSDEHEASSHHHQDHRSHHRPKSPQNIDLDKAFIDKSNSTEFRVFYQSILNQKEDIQFKENFQSFYGQIFAQVQVPKKATKLKPQFQCEICDGEEFLSIEDHSKAVFYPYCDFVMEAGLQNRTGFKRYVRNLFGEEAVGRSVQELMETIDGFSFYECEGFAVEVLSEVERIGQATLLGKLPDIEEDQGNGILSLQSDHRLKALNAIPGALHVLLGSPNKGGSHTDPRGIFDHLLIPLLTEALRRKQFELIGILSKCPRLLGNIKKVLSENGMRRKFEGDIDRKIHSRRFYVAGLLLLRAIYNYKKNRIPEMLIDLNKANLLAVGHPKIMNSIASFIVTTPMIHEKIANIMTQQFLQLPKFMQVKYLTFIPKSETRDILSDQSHTGLLSDYFDIWSTMKDKERKGQDPSFDAIEKKMLMNSDAPDVVAMNYLDLAKIAPGEAAMISCYTQAIAYFFKAMQSSGEITMKYAYIQLIEKVCEMLKPHAITEHNDAYYSLYVMRTKLSFLLRAHFHLDRAIGKFNEKTKFSQTLGKILPDHVPKPITGLSCGSKEKIGGLVGEWEKLLRIRLLCPLSTTEIYSCVDGDLNLRLGATLNKRIALEKMNHGGNVKIPKLPTHNPERENEFPSDPKRLGKIFNWKPGHFPNDTPQARKQLTKLVKKEKNYVGTDMLGKRWYSKTLRNGEQLWAFTQNNVLWDGGMNKAGDTREFNSTTGMQRRY